MIVGMELGENGEKVKVVGLERCVVMLEVDRENSGMCRKSGGLSLLGSS